MPPKIQILTLNSKSIKSSYKWSQLMSFLEVNEPDIVFLQETNTPQTTTIEKNSKYSFIVNESQQDYSGTIIGINKASPIKIICTSIVVASYLQIVKVMFNNEVWNLINIYIPHDNQRAEIILNALHSSLGRCLANHNDRILIGGDFNCTFNPSLDRKGSLERNVKISTRLEKIISKYLLYDCWRVPT